MHYRFKSCPTQIAAIWGCNTTTGRKLPGDKLYKSASPLPCLRMMPLCLYIQIHTACCHTAFAFCPICVCSCWCLSSCARHRWLVFAPGAMCGDARWPINLGHCALHAAPSPPFVTRALPSSLQATHGVAALWGAACATCCPTAILLSMAGCLPSPELCYSSPRAHCAC